MSTFTAHSRLVRRRRRHPPAPVKLEGTVTVTRTSDGEILGTLALSMPQDPDRPRVMTATATRAQHSRWRPPLAPIADTDPEIRDFNDLDSAFAWLDANPNIKDRTHWDKNLLWLGGDDLLRQVWKTTTGFVAVAERGAVPGSEVALACAYRNGAMLAYIERTKRGWMQYGEGGPKQHDSGVEALEALARIALGPDARGAQRGSFVRGRDARRAQFRVVTRALTRMDRERRKKSADEKSAAVREGLVQRARLVGNRPQMT